MLPPTISADDIGSYVNANLSRLERFVDRELYFRRADEEIPSEDALSTPEVVDEVIARALGDHDRPEKLSLEPWLYRLALQAMNEMTARLHELESAHLISKTVAAGKMCRLPMKLRPAIPSARRGLDPRKRNSRSPRVHS